MMTSYLLIADVLGFSNIVKRLPSKILNERINKWTNLVQEARENSDIRKLQLVSDTVFALEEHTEDGYYRLLQFSKLLLEKGMDNFFPIRGAIARGEVSWSEFIYGGAVLEAHELERSLEWIGIAGKQLQDVPWSWDLVCRYAPPLKGGLIEQMAVVSWNVPDHEILLEKWKASGMLGKDEKIGWDKYAKIMNTMIFSTYLHNAQVMGLGPETFNPSIPSAVRPPHKWIRDKNGNLHHRVNS